MQDARLLISIHDRCQYRCHFCVYLHTRAGRTMRLAQWLDILGKARSSGFTTLEIGGRGEPTLSADFGKIVDKAYALGFRIELLSNGQNYRAIVKVLPKLEALTINLNAVQAKDFLTIHNPVRGILFSKTLANVGMVISQVARNDGPLGLKINYVISPRSLAAAPSFPESVNKLFSSQLGPRRKIYIVYQHMHNYVQPNESWKIRRLRFQQLMLFFQRHSRKAYLVQHTNWLEFVAKTRNMIEQLDVIYGRPRKTSRHRGGKTFYTCDVYKRVLFVDNNGDLFGCFNPFRVANGLSIRQDPFYWGNAVGQDWNDVISRQQDIAPTIDVAREYWQACLFCKAIPVSMPVGGPSLAP